MKAPIRKAYYLSLALYFIALVAALLIIFRRPLSETMLFANATLVLLVTLFLGILLGGFTGTLTALVAATVPGRLERQRSFSRVSMVLWLIFTAFVGWLFYRTWQEMHAPVRPPHLSLNTELGYLFILVMFVANNLAESITRVQLLQRMSRELPRAE